MLPVKISRECRACHSFTTEDPAIAACPVCGNTRPELWATDTRCLACGGAVTGACCTACWEKLPPWKRALYRARQRGMLILGAVGRWLVRVGGRLLLLCRLAAARVGCQYAGGEALLTQLELGARMAALGLGEEGLRRRLAALDAQLGALEVARGAMKPLLREREGLLLALAAGALAADAPPAPEVKEAHARARQARKALEERCEQAKRLHRELFGPPAPPG